MKKILPLIVAISLLLSLQSHGGEKRKRTTSSGSLRSDELSAIKNDVPFFALLVGSNRPGPNQAPLQYAHKDLKKMRDLLIEIGRHSPDNIQELIDPGSETLVSAIGRIKKQIAQLPRARQSRFVFYYSGHAKANALTLGNQVLSLQSLRKALADIPSAQKIVILDACQSGSYSRIKGVRVTEDFSHNSRETLQTSGTAVLASSSAEELSQESDDLEGSVFTHNLVTGLRGAADADSNGRVSLFEAYDYAYNNTLVATADTRVGEQHVTLETDLKGTGETVLSWPESANAKIIFPEDIQGKVFIFEENTKSIHAEIHKAKGSSITLAFPPNNYGVIITHNQRVLNCPVHLKENSTVKLLKDSCQTTVLKTGKAKAQQNNGKDKYRYAGFIEMQVGLLFLQKDDYIRRLQQLDYDSKQFFTNSEFGVPRSRTAMMYYEFLVGMWFNRYVAGAFLFSNLDELDFFRYASGDIMEERRTYSIEGRRFSLQGRAQYGFLNDRIKPYMLFDAGLARVTERYSHLRYEKEEAWTAYPSSTATYSENHWGPAIGLGVGITIGLFRRLQIVAQTKYVYAPVLKNNYDERQNAGGLIMSAGLHLGH